MPLHPSQVPATDSWVDASRFDIGGDCAIDDSAHYLVKTNGDEWHDVSLYVMPGAMLRHQLRQNIIRGRPAWVARVYPPAI